MVYPSITESQVLSLAQSVRVTNGARLRAYARAIYPQDPDDVVGDAVLLVVQQPWGYVVRNHPLTEEVMFRYLLAIVRLLALARSRRETVRGRVIATNLERWRRSSIDPADVAHLSERSPNAREAIMGTGA